MFVQTEFNKSNNNELSRRRDTAAASETYDGIIGDLDVISRFCMPICSRDNEIREVALDAISKTVEGWLDGVGSPKRYHHHHHHHHHLHHHQADHRRRLQTASNGCACSAAAATADVVNDIPKEYLELVALHLPIILRLSLSCPFVNVREKCQHILEIVQSRGLPIPYPVISGPSAYIDPEENVVAAVITSSPYKNNLIDKNKKKQEKENKLTRTKNKKKTGRKKNKTDSEDEYSEEEDAIQFGTDSEPDELMGQECPDSVDAECMFCQRLFSEDTRGETWIKCLMCALWAHIDCAGPEFDTWICDFWK